MGKLPLPALLVVGVGVPGVSCTCMPLMRPMALRTRPLSFIASHAASMESDAAASCVHMDEVRCSRRCSLASGRPLDS